MASEQAASAASYAASGAKLGSAIIPGIGTVIGAVVGAIVGWLSAKKKPVRPTAQQLADCKALLTEYSGYAAQMPTTPIPLDEAQLKNLNWCLQAYYGKDIKNLDPRFFDGSFTDLLAIARSLVKAIYNTPVGGTVQVSETVNKVRGQTFRSSGISFTNPAFTSIQVFSETKFLDVAIQYCDQTAGKGRGGCPGLYNRPEYRRWLMDLFGFAARTELPNISEDDLKAASVIAQQTGSAASEVVKAVEQVMGRSVERGETAVALAPATTAVTAAPGNVQTPATGPPTPAVSTVPSTSYVTPAAGPSSLYQSLFPATSSTTPAATSTITAGISGMNPWLLAGGAALAVIFATARPKR